MRQRTRAEVGFHELDTLDKLGTVPKADTLIVYANLIGGCDDQGVFLLPQNATADAPETFLRLEGLLENFRTMEPQRHKLLVLDIGRAPIDWRLGQLTPPDWSQWRERVQQIPGLAVICANAPGEQSWTTTSLGAGQSVFGHYVAQGLAGQADTDGDDKVRVTELYRYVLANSANWVLNNRDEQAQQPVLLPPLDELGERDFTLIRATQEPLDERRFAESGSGWGELERIGEKVEHLDRHQAAARLDPLRVREVDHLLRRSEEALRAGQPALAADLLRRAEDRIERLRQIDDSPLASITNDPLLLRNLGRFWGVIAATPGVPVPVASQPYLLPEEVLERNLHDFQVKFPVSEPLSEDLVTRVIENGRLAEEVNAVPVGTLPWIRDTLRKTDERRRSIEDRLFLRDVSGDLIARELDGVAVDYRAALQRAADVEQARRVWDSVSLELPALAAWAAWRDGDRDQRQQLLQLALSSDALLTNNTLAPDSELQTISGSINDDGQQLEVEVLELFVLTRQLQNRLDVPAEGDDPDRAAKGLRVLSASIDRMATDIRTRLQNDAAEQVRQNPDPPQPLHRQRIVDILRAPGLSADVPRDSTRSCGTTNRKWRRRPFRRLSVKPDRRPRPTVTNSPELTTMASGTASGSYR